MEGKLAKSFVELVNACSQFQCLPQAGGLLDQDSFITYGMSLVSRARADKQAEDDHKSGRHRRN